jgi:hypothetical protein
MTGWLTLAGLIVVALITAYTTDRRLSRQIEAERHGQERLLAAEAQRQAATLAHDRELADIADLRRLLDATAETMNKAGEALHSLRGQFREEGVSLERTPRRRVAAQGKKLKAFADRLRIRLGPDASIPRHCDEAHDALYKMWSVTDNLGDAESVATVRDALLSEEEAFDQAVEAFLEGAIGVAGTAQARANRTEALMAP